MSRFTFRITFALALTAFLLMAASHPGAGAQQPAAAESPEDTAGREALGLHCSQCHEANLVEGPFRTPEEWNEVMDRMASYGADIGTAGRAQVVTYLLRTFGKVRINTAPAADLAPVLDITREQAEALVAYRNKSGPFKTLDDLKAAPGADAAKVDRRKDRLVF